MRNGFIKIWRKILDLFGQFREPYDRRSAWIDIVLQAQWRDGWVTINTNRYFLKRGQFIASYRYLSKRWNWTKRKVQVFFIFLIKEKMLVTPLTTPDGTVYVIAKYEQYQGVESGNVTASVTGSVTPLTPKQRSIKEDKNKKIPQADSNKPTLREIQNRELTDLTSTWRNVFVGLADPTPAQLNLLIYGVKGSGKDCFEDALILKEAILSLRGKGIKTPFLYLKTIAKDYQTVHNMRKRSQQKHPQTIGEILREEKNGCSSKMEQYD